MEPDDLLCSRNARNLMCAGFGGLHVWDKPGLSDYLVCLGSLMQPNKPDQPNSPNEHDSLLGLFDRLLE
jgi:hypothetical protein